MKRFSLRRQCLQVTALLGCSLATGIGYSQSSDGGGLYGLGITDDGTVAFSWKANTESNLAGYRLYVGTVPGVYSGFIDVGLSTTFRVSDLFRGHTYYFALTAYNTAGIESDFTPELSALIPFPSSGGLAVVPPGGETTSTNESVSPEELGTNYTEVVSQPPFFEALQDIVLPEGTTNYSVLLLGLRCGMETESHALSITASSSAPELIPDPVVSYSATDGTATLVLSPLAGSIGAATITVAANNGQPQNNSFSRTFNVTVEALNSPPQITSLPRLVIPKNRATGPIPFTVLDAETAREHLAITVISSNPEIVPSSGLTLTPEGLTIDPSNGRIGASTITLMVSDGTASSSTSFEVTIF